MRNVKKLNLLQTKEHFKNSVSSSNWEWFQNRRKDNENVTELLPIGNRLSLFHITFSLLGYYGCSRTKVIRFLKIILLFNTYNLLKIHSL